MFILVINKYMGLSKLTKNDLGFFVRTLLDILYIYGYSLNDNIICKNILPDRLKKVNRLSKILSAADDAVWLLIILIKRRARK